VVHKQKRIERDGIEREAKLVTQLHSNLLVFSEENNQQETLIRIYYKQLVLAFLVQTAAFLPVPAM
jgi:hypothetical protein